MSRIVPHRRAPGSRPAPEACASARPTGRDKGWRAIPYIVLIAMTLAGCRDRDATAPATPSIAGQWSGSARLGLVRFEATFTQTGETVGGTGEFSSPLGSGPFTIAGTVRGRNVDLVLVSTQFGTTTYIGRFTGANTIEGDLQNPDEALTIRRDD